MTVFNSWRTLTIDQCCSRVTSGGTPSRRNPSFYENGTIPWAKTGELKDRIIEQSRIREWITEEALSKSSAKLLPKDTVLMAMYGDGQTIGSVGLVQSPISCNQACCAMITNPAVCEARFLFYAVRNYREDWIKIAHGGAQRNLSGTIIRKREIAVPSLQTQQRIASILSAYDELIGNNTRRIAILEEMARRLYEEWFVDFRFPGHEELEFEGELPKGWTARPLGEVCSKITDGAHKSPPTAASGLPMASVKDMHTWGLDFTGSRLISLADFEELVRNNCKPIRNDILIAKDGANLNKYTFLVTEEKEVVLLSSIAILRPGKAVNPEFLVAQLKSEEVSQRIKMMRSGAAIPRIVLKDFKRLDALIPPRAIQEEWVALAGPIHALCRSLVNKNANLRAQRDLLLPKLVSGEIDVSDAKGALEAAE